ncbi:globin [Motiliproteus sediminis]|uniref:globin n=1 Tax=Motiliproteus sediminis TaxID=1468178 RepID=UPI001AF010DB|nr:globin [Motiliproteus sediminis]
MEFIDNFYQRFMETSSDVTARFANVDMDHQVVMLRGSLELMLGCVHEQDPAQSLAALAELHSRRGVDIPPQLYDYWLSSLLSTVRAYDHECDAELLAAWERVLSPGIRCMKAGY